MTKKGRQKFSVIRSFRKFDPRNFFVLPNSVPSLRPWCNDTVASIWFEIWGAVDPGQKFLFSSEISEKFRFFQAISQTKKSIFQRKFPKNVGFFQVISRKI